MLKLDFNNSYRKGKITGNDNALRLLRSNFSQPVKDIGLVRARANNPFIPDTTYAIQPTGMYDFGLSQSIIDILEENDIEFEQTEEFVNRYKCSYNVEDVFDGLIYENRYYGIETLQVALEYGHGTVLWATGAGKCYGKGTKILKYDGTIENVENLRVGDKLMGPDSSPRVIDSLATGVDNLYRITPHRYAEPVIVNSEHILVLKVTNRSNKKKKRLVCPNGKKYDCGDIVKISVKDYLKSSVTFKHCTKWYQTGVDFEKSDELLEIPPYLLGFWLGDGCKYNATVCKPNSFEALKEETDKMGWGCEEIFYDYKSCPTISITGGFRVALRNMNLLTNKHIPEKYLISSRENREQLLAGLLDSDGSVSKCGWDFGNTNENIIDGVMFLARSLGYAVGFKNPRITKSQDGTVCNSWRVHISPNSPIKTKIKHAPQRMIDKNTSYTGFKIESIGVGDYYGFSVIGNDRMHLLGDFSVAHNSFLQASLIENIWMNSPKPFKCLIIVPGLNLVNQLLENFEEYGVNFTYSGWTGGVDGMKLQNTETVICNSENFCSKFDANQKWIRNIDLLLVDECHKINSSSIVSKKIQKIFTPHKFGFTGTLPTDKMDKWKVIGTFGPAIYEKNSKELRDEGFLTSARIKIVKLNHKYPPRMTYREELDFIYTSEARNKIIKKLVSGLNQNVLIIVNHTEHGKDILDLMSTIEGREAYFINGEMPVDERMDIIKKMENQNNIVTTANAACFSTGINIKNLHYILFIVGGKSFIRTVQSIGRGLRLHESKNKLTLFDICDNLKYSEEHLAHRKEFYDYEKIGWSEMEINL